MKVFKFSIVLLLFTVFMTSCNTVRVASDYDQQANFGEYQTYAFFKPGIDKADISDLDKKRILRAIEDQMAAKGFTKSENPDVLVSIFTKSKENINIHQNNMMGWGWGWGWNPWMWGGWGGGLNTVSTNTEGTLFIDLIDADQKELIWQGMGTASLPTKVEKKQEKINKIVEEILEKYPPQRTR